jgi:hypothetical protein
MVKTCGAVAPEQGGIRPGITTIGRRELPFLRYGVDHDVSNFSCPASGFGRIFQTNSSDPEN